MAPSGGLSAFADPNLVPSLLGEVHRTAFSLVAVTGGWPEDLERLAASVRVHCAGTGVELVVVANASPAVAAAADELAAGGSDVRGVHFTQHVGYAAAVNTGIAQSRGAVVAVVGTSVEATGDFLTPSGEALADPSVGVVGRWGLRTRDLRSFDEETTGDVHAMQGYCMAFRRADVETVGLLDTGYKFYRNADIDWSLNWLDHGFRIRALDLPLERHAHREWEALTPDQRDRRSRDNFARLLRRWRDREDLFA